MEPSLAEAAAAAAAAAATPGRLDPAASCGGVGTGGGDGGASGDVCGLAANEEEDDDEDEDEEEEEEEEEEEDFHEGAATVAKVFPVAPSGVPGGTGGFALSLLPPTTAPKPLDVVSAGGTAAAAAAAAATATGCRCSCCCSCCCRGGGGDGDGDGRPSSRLRSCSYCRCWSSRRHPPSIGSPKSYQRHLRWARRAARSPSKSAGQGPLRVTSVQKQPPSRRSRTSCQASRRL